jgi:hypothetical protein
MAQKLKKSITMLPISQQTNLKKYQLKKAQTFVEVTFLPSSLLHMYFDACPEIEVKTLCSSLHFQRYLGI